MSGEFAAIRERTVLPLTMVMAGVLAIGTVELQPQESVAMTVQGNAATQPMIYPEGSSSDKPIDNARKSATEIGCTTLIAEGAPINLTDCKPLPRLITEELQPITSSINGYKCGRLVAEVPVVPNSKGQVRTGNLPVEWQEAVTESLHDDDVTRALAPYAEGGVQIYASYNDENGYYYDFSPSSENRVNKDSITLCPDADGPARNLYSSKLAVGEVLRHEATHAFYQTVYDLAYSNEPEANAAAATLELFVGLCSEEYKLIAEEYRASHVDETTRALTILRNQFPDTNAYVGAIDELISRFNTVHGLDDLAANDSGQFKTASTALYDYLDIILKKELGSQFRLSDQAGIDQEAWNLVSGDFADFYRKQLGYITESFIFKEATSATSGHPDNPTEQLASLINTTEGHPSGVIVRIQKLSPEHRLLALQKIRMAKELIELLDKELADKLGLNKVLESFSQPGPVYKVRVPELRKVIEGLEGDWRQLPAASSRS